jgi:hypothetical protein
MKSDESKEKITERGEVMSRRLIIFLGGLFIVVAFISTSVIFNLRGAEKGDLESENTLISELADSAEGLPDYATGSPRTKAAYAVALEIPEALEAIPCYCSCGAIGHKSLKECYLSPEGGFEEHASFCDICVNEALDVYTWQHEGVPLSEIRSRIDEKYSRFGAPTDTP